MLIWRMFKSCGMHEDADMLRFAANVRPGSENECSVWAGCYGSANAGAFRYDGRTQQAHRAAYQIYVDRNLPRDHFVRQTCGTKNCVTPDHLEALGRAPASRLQANIFPVPHSGCWLWMGAVDSNGYGRVSKVAYGNSLAHRAVYELVAGRIVPPAPNNVLRHTCDTPTCVNPDHLVAGTQADNVADMMRRGRHHTQKGDRQKRC